MIEYKRFPISTDVTRVFVYENSPLPGVPFSHSFDSFLLEQAKIGWQLAGIIPGKEHPIAEHCTLGTMILVREKPKDELSI